MRDLNLEKVKLYIGEGCVEGGLVLLETIVRIMEITAISERVVRLERIADKIQAIPSISTIAAHSLCLLIRMWWLI